MQADISRVDLLLQYILLVAGENDEPAERELGPIHLIKYVYLADLANARRCQGRTFTGAAWQFYKFGPWTQEVNERIQPALHGIGANVRTFPSDYEGKDSWERWSLRDEQILRQREKAIPAYITLRLTPEVRKFGKDTPALLEHVYRTAPMLEAAPGDLLDFASVAPPMVVARTMDHAAPLLDMEADHAAPLLIVEAPLRDVHGEHTRQDLKGFKKGLASLQKRYQSRSPRRLINPVPNPRYDAIYEEGLAWLDTLAGERLEPGEKIAEFTDDVWKSVTRKGGDVS
jgi:hypothetical protein